MCSNEALEASEDAEFLHHVLTSAVGPRLFYQLPKLTARPGRAGQGRRPSTAFLLRRRYMRKIALSPGCLEDGSPRRTSARRASASQEFQSRSEFEERATSGAHGRGRPAAFRRIAA